MDDAFGSFGVLSSSLRDGYFVCTRAGSGGIALKLGSTGGLLWPPEFVPMVGEPLLLDANSFMTSSSAVGVGFSFLTSVVARSPLSKNPLPCLIGIGGAKPAQGGIGTSVAAAIDRPVPLPTPRSVCWRGLVVPTGPLQALATPVGDEHVPLRINGPRRVTTAVK
jgi:hypothetical protein